MEIKQQLVKDRTKTSGSGNPCVGIAIHETANTGKGANAQAHANLQSNGGGARTASWHWTVDDKQAIQSYPHDVKCWHAGVADGNNRYIAIEICVNSDGNYDQAVRNAAELVRYIQRQTPSAKLIRQHNSFSGKNCPTGLRAGRDGHTWNGFLALVAGASGGAAPAPAPTAPADPAKRIDEDGEWGGDTTFWQQVAAGTPRDKVISSQWKTAANARIHSAQWDTTRRGSALARWIQQRLVNLGKLAPNTKIDGLIGSDTISGLQQYYGTPADNPASISPRSPMVLAMQREINSGFFLGVRI